MNLKHILKVTGSVALSAVMATASIPVTVYAEENTSKTNESSDKQTASSTKKTETVYAVLDLFLTLLYLDGCTMILASKT